jgi:hypothetical protein
MMRASIPFFTLVPCLLTATLMLEGCGTTKVAQPRESFRAADTPYSARIRQPSKVACWSVKRAFLAQGYMLDRATADAPTLTGVKEFQTDDETNVVLRLQTSCADNGDGTSTVYATAMREVNKLQRETQHHSAGVAWATITVPSGSAKVLRPLRRETVSEPEFYRRFYALVSQLAEEDARKAVK